LTFFAMSITAGCRFDPSITACRWAGGDEVQRAQVKVTWVN
jgi:hypothetical protein